MKEINLDRVYLFNRHHKIKILHDFSPLKSFTLSNANLEWHLRVLLAKRPDICAPIFLMPHLFGCIIKSTPLGGVPKAKSWDLGAYTVPWGAIYVLGLK